MSIKQIAMRGYSKNKPAPPNNPNPDKSSNRSKKRASRGFISLEVSSRKHRRANNRLAISQTINGRRHPAGIAVPNAYSADDFDHHSGGKLNYH